MAQILDPGPDPEPQAPAAATTPRAVAYGLLGLAIPFAVLVLWAMVASSAAATGGCGGG